jgi:Phage tail sheath protein subtilisin-like domain
MPTLVSPGVAVSVVDESAYASGGNGTVPLIILATAQNKMVPGGTSIAAKTTKATAGYPVLLTSQRDLAQQFGAPIFKTLNGTPQHGNELNEYGLLAAHSFLGFANRAYVIRADIDLGALEPVANAPTGAPSNGQHWLDLTSTVFGLFEANGTDWVEKTPMIITSSANLGTDGAPDPMIGSTGDYAVVTTSSANAYYKKVDTKWIRVTTAIAGTPDSIGATVYTQPHYNYPLPTVSGDVWFKTTTPNKGFLPVVKKFSKSAGQWVQLNVPAFLSDSVAEETFGPSLAVGDVYAMVTADTASFTLRRYDGSSWSVLSYDANYVAPVGATAEGSLWYNTELVSDMYVKKNGKWFPVSNDVTIDTAEPMVSAAGDIWIDTNDMENYPVIKRFDGNAWILRDNADQTTPNGVVFADLTATPSDSSNGGAATPWDEIETPDPQLHPDGMLLWNGMVSTYNVKQYTGGLWHSISGNYASGPRAGAMYSGSRAVRQVIVKAMQAAVMSSDRLREETVKFSLIAAPAYPELADEMLSLNVDRKETGFVIIDSPLTLGPDAQGLIDWVSGVNAGSNGIDGLVTKSSEAAVYYPSVLTTNLDGSDVVAPASHSVLRTYAYSDSVSYPWFAPAGLTRGVVTNATNFGYVNSSGEFQALALNNGQRDTLYANKINPLVNFPSQGLVVWGQKTLSPIATAMDRVNVARLVAYLREQFDLLARPFIFEPNDQATRSNIKSLFDRFMGDVMQKRGVSDFINICDTSNNFASRIDANELWLDSAMAPMHSAEMIYIPLRITSTGALKK